MGDKWEQWQTIFLGSKSMKVKDAVPWKESYDKPRQCTEKQRHHFADKVHLVKATVFPLVMYHKESWTIKEVECWRIDAFKLWCWRRLLRAPWTARTSNQSILKETNSEYSLDGLRLKLKPQYFGYLMWRADLLEKTLMLRKTEGKSRRGWQRMDMNLRKLWETVVDTGVYCAAVREVTKCPSNWTIPLQQSIHATNWEHLVGSGEKTVKTQSLIKSSTSLVTGTIYNWIINLKVRIDYKIRWVLIMTCQLWTLIIISYCKVCKKTLGHRRPSLSCLLSFSYAKVI